MVKKHLYLNNNGELQERNNDFTGLEDTPSDYDGQGGKVVAVKNTEDGLRFIDESVNAEQILAKPVYIPSFSGKDGYILAYDESEGQFYLKKDEGGEGGEGVGCWELMTEPLFKGILNWGINLTLTDIVID